MTRFKQALLEELQTRAAAPAQPLPIYRRLRPQFAAAVVAGTVAAAGLVATTISAPAYAVDKNSDGTVTITFERIADTEAATADLQEAGVRARVVSQEAQNTCLRSLDPADDAWIGKSTNPGGLRVSEFAVGRRYLEMSTNHAIFRPREIPADKLVLLTQIPDSGGSPERFTMTYAYVPSSEPACSG